MIFFTVGLLCLMYYGVIVVYAGVTADFAWIWLMGGILCGGSGLILRLGEWHPESSFSIMSKVILGIWILGLLLFAMLCARVVQGMYGRPDSDLTYVVVLGAQVKGQRPSRALKKRLDQAWLYAKENPETILVLSGGQGSGEDITEAECMRRYLSEKGLSEKRMVLEERSVNTRENLVFSNELTGCAGEKTGILSNNFHVYRAVKLAKKQGYQDPVGIPAPSDPIMQLHYVVREVFALLKEKAAGNV